MFLLQSLSFTFTKNANPLNAKTTNPIAEKIDVASPVFWKFSFTFSLP